MDELDIVAKTAMERLIKDGDFCEVVSDKFVEHGTKRGHVVYVAGHKAIPENPEDLYTQRIKLLVHKMDRQGHVLPDEGVYIMDPSSLQKVKQSRQDIFRKILEEDFGKDESTD